MMKYITVLSLLLCSGVSYAATLPVPQEYDYRITAAKYNPLNVINVRTKIGASTLIQLEEGEEVLGDEKGLNTGFPEAWGFKIIDNGIFFKPKHKNPDTNLILTTNKNRTYAFYLQLTDYPHYIVKMQYEKVKTASDYSAEIPCSDGKTNFDYVKWGNDSLSPRYMWDDGRFTCLKFANNSELPVAYQVASDGSESMINYSIKKDTMILHGISKEFRLRLGTEVLGLRTDKAVSSGYNHKGTTIDAKRELNNE